MLWHWRRKWPRKHLDSAVPASSDTRGAHLGHRTSAMASSCSFFKVEYVWIRVKSLEDIPLSPLPLLWSCTILPNPKVTWMASYKIQLFQKVIYDKAWGTMNEVSRAPATITDIKLWCIYTCQHSTLYKPKCWYISINRLNLYPSH